MNHLPRLLLTLGMTAFTAGASAQTEALNVIPRPAHVQQTGHTFRFTPSTQIVYSGREARSVADYFCTKLRTSTSTKFAAVRKAKQGPAVSFVIDPTVKGDEAYALDVTETGVTARAATSAGLFYAAQTLLQLMPPDVEQSTPVAFGAWSVPTVSITDSPRFAYRGVMLDPCRHFIPVSAVKKQIDVLASYKINRMHWHLTDDQGWRIEIRKYPRLTQVGAQRTEGDGSITRGYYTQDEIRDVVAYARERHIEVIPELEMPGHELAAIAAYPDLSCKGDSTTPRIIWGVEDIVMCPGKENMFVFLQNVIDEMVQLFPSRYFHIGGDESPRGEWTNCPACQSRMKSLGYDKEAQLQSYIIGRMEKYLRTKGKTIIGWDEILEGGNLDTTAVVMSWRGEQGGITAAKAGHHVLMTPSSHGLYFDQFQGDVVTEPVCAIGGYSTLQKVYSYDPVPAEVHAAGKDDMVLGLQANCWSEYMHTPSVLEYRLFPRALALAEVGWTATADKNFPDFQRRVDGDAALRLRARRVNFHIPEPEQPGGSLDHLAFVSTDTITLKNPRQLPMVYTLDGTQPTLQSTRYSTPIVVSQSTVVNTATVLPCGILSPVRTIYVQKEQYAPAVKEVGATTAGLLLTKWEGTYQRPSQVTAEPQVKDSVVSGFEALRTLTRVPASVRNVKNYYAEAEGYVSIPADGIYEFSTNNCQLFIDGRLFIDNSLEAIPRYSRHNRQLALSAGLHRIRCSFMGGIFSGWPTYWDDAKVRMRPEGGKWKDLQGDDLKH